MELRVGNAIMLNFIDHNHMDEDAHSWLADHNYTGVISDLELKEGADEKSFTDEDVERIFLEDCDYAFNVNEIGYSIKEYFGEMTIIHRVAFRCNDISLEAATNKILASYLDGDVLRDENGDVVAEIEEYIDSRNVRKVADGNVRESGVKDFYIEAEDDHD